MRLNTKASHCIRSLAAAAATLLLASCATSQPPPWIISPPATSDGEYVVGRGEGGDEGEALVSARRRAYARFLERMGVEIEVVDQVVTQELTNSDGHPTAMTRSQERVHTRAQGFLKRTRVERRHLRRDQDGRVHGHVLVHVPTSEIARIREAVERRQAAKWEPAWRLYRDAVADYRAMQDAVAGGEMGRALQLADTALKQAAEAQGHETWNAARNRVIDEPGWPYPLEARQVIDQILGEVVIEPTRDPVELVTGESGSDVILRATRGGAPVVDLPLALELPSGRQKTDQTDRSGIATFTVPAPAIPGRVELAARASLPASLGSESAVSTWSVPVRVTGERRLATGRFHDAIEAEGVGEAHQRDGESRAAVSQRAITAAQVNAFASVVGETKATRESVVENRRLVSARSRFTSDGPVGSAAIVDTTLEWAGEVATARVIVRVSAGKGG